MSCKKSRRKFLKTVGIAPFVSKTTAITSLASLGGCATAPFNSKQSYLAQIIHPKNNNTVFHWLDIAMQQTRDQRVAPPRAAYNFSMPLVAGFLAANAISQEYQQPFNIDQADPQADPQIAYGVAFATAAAEVFQTPLLLEKRAFLKQFPASKSKDLSITIGKKIAKEIIRLRNDDGSEASEVNYYFDHYPKQKGVLAWKPTGPLYGAKPGPAFNSFARGLYPSQGKIKPWTMRSSHQFRTSEFYSPDSREFAEEFALIKALGAHNSQVRTKEQSDIALFWEDGPWGITPPGHFLYIAIQVLQNERKSFIELAQHFALLGMVLCDASINAWDNKYHYDIIRPESAIRLRAPLFNNQDTRVKTQSNWQSYIPTPEFPSYTSGHSTFGSASMKMLTLICGKDNIKLSGQSPDLVLWPQLKGITRHWNSLSEIAEENGLSRIYGGVHWMLDHKMGMQAGEQIAQQAFEEFFKKRV